MTFSTHENKWQNISNGTVSPAPNFIINGGIASATQAATSLFIVRLAIAPVVSVIGILGNTLNIFVFLYDRKVHHINIYFLCLALSDLSFLICVFFMSFVEFVKRMDYVVGQSLYCYMVICDANFLYLVFVRISTGLVLLISIERFVAVCFPFKAKHLALARYPWTSCITLATLVILYMIPNLLHFQVTETHGSFANTTILTLKYTKLYKSTNILKVQYLVGTLLFHVVPVFTVVALNMAIIISLKRWGKIISKLTTMTGGKKETQMTQTLLGVSLTFICCLTPGSVVNIVRLSLPIFDLFQKEHYLYLIFLRINLVLESINAAMNCFVYFWSNGKFRSTLRSICRKNNELTGPHRQNVPIDSSN